MMNSKEMGKPQTNLLLDFTNVPPGIHNSSKTIVVVPFVCKKRFTTYTVDASSGNHSAGVARWLNYYNSRNSTGLTKPSNISVV